MGGNANNIEDNPNNVIKHKRGETPCVSEREMSIRRQKHQLMTRAGMKPTCVDFGGDQEAMYPRFFSTNPVLNGIIEQWKIKD